MHFSFHDAGLLSSLVFAVLTVGSAPDTVFRMYTKARNLLYIRTRTQLVVDKWTAKPKFIISTQEVLE